VCRQTDFLLVIGAGVVGLSIARALALAGKAVTIIDQSDYGTAASGSNLGQIFVSDRDPGLEHDLVLESLNIYQETERHNSLQYTRTGGLFTLDDEGETAIAEPLVREEKEPYIENAAGAVYSPLEGSINPFKVISWLYDQALAAGSWSRELCGTIGLDLPVDYIRGTAMVTEPLPRVLNGPVVGGFFSHAIAVASFGGSVLEADENSLAFPGSTLPAVMTAGAAQTLCNIQRVLPGERVLMIGTGNVGLIVSYQLMQAGAEVCAAVEAADRIGGCDVHANKLRRAEVSIYLSHTITAALGEESVEGAVIAAVDELFRPVSGSSRELKVDTIGLAVGLSPRISLLLNDKCRSSP
jgi:siroheme synthase (precorrin-2 oxidase/ferrochelatase)